MSSTINETWKACTLASLVGCLMLFIFLNETHQVARNTLANLAPSAQLYPSPTMQIALEKQDILTISQIYSKEANFTIITSDQDETVEVARNTIAYFAPSPQVDPFPIIFDDFEKEANFTINQTNQDVTIQVAELISPLPTELNALEKEENISISSTKVPATPVRKECNIYDGKWVYKQEEFPSYNSTICPFLEEKMSCQKNGRPDSEYEKWRWEAKECDIPMFNGTDMLHRLRDKRMIVVGDSLNRNLWESLACLLYSSISPSRAQVKAENPAYKVLKAKDYNFTLEFYWSPFLIKHDQGHKSGKKVLVLEEPSDNSKQWRGADVMVFNSGHWWAHSGKFKRWDLYQYRGKLMEDMPIEQAYEHGMRTWFKWIQSNVNPNNTSVFFRSISAQHQGKQWCYNSTQPIMDESYESHFPKSLIETIEGVINDSNVKYLNITKLSQYRRDAHPSVYRSWKWKIYTKSYKRLIPSYADCSHWCLPGLPDTWNRLLYSSLFFEIPGSVSSY